jgi:hypothetical protein
MRQTLAAVAALAFVVLAFVLPWRYSAAQMDVLVFERPSNEWFEGPLTQVSISPNGKWALFSGFGAPHLYSLDTGHHEPELLRGGLDRLDAADFCGPDGFLRVGARGMESGIFMPGKTRPELSSLPPDASTLCSPDGRTVAYFRPSAPERGIFVGTRGKFRSYHLTGNLVGWGFSPDGEILCAVLFQPNGESSLITIEVHSGNMRAVATHLDASPTFTSIAVAPDCRRAYLPLASDAAPDNESRHKPDADRWLKIYEIGFATGALRRLVDSSGQDNNGPAVVNGSLYWTRTVIHDSIVTLPVTGGEAKEVIGDGEVPMWSPDSKRIAYTFGGWRLADWALNLDDGVVNVDENAQRASEPSVIVSGYHEDFPPAWSPDGKWIAFHSHRSARPVPEYSSPGSTDDIYLRLAEDTHAPEVRLTDFGWETGPAYWSPDGQKLMFESWQRGGRPGIDKVFVLTMDAQIGVVRKTEMLALDPQIHDVAWSAWSPDGQEIAIEDNRGSGKRVLWIVRADGNHAQKLLDYEGSTYGGLDWTHDGKRIIFAGLAGDRLQLFSVARAGGEPRQLSHDSGNLMHPRVSPDGRWIACTRIVQSKQIWRRPF